MVHYALTSNLLLSNQNLPPHMVSTISPTRSFDHFLRRRPLQSLCCFVSDWLFTLQPLPVYQKLLFFHASDSLSSVIKLYSLVLSRNHSHRFFASWHSLSSLLQQWFNFFTTYSLPYGRASALYSFSTSPNIPRTI